MKSYELRFETYSPVMFITDIPTSIIFLEIIQRIFSVSPLSSQYKGWIEWRFITCREVFIKKSPCSPRTHQSIVRFTKCPWKKYSRKILIPNKNKISFFRTTQEILLPEVRKWGSSPSSSEDKATNVKERKSKIVRRENGRDLKHDIVNQWKLSSVDFVSEINGRGENWSV